MAARKKEKRVKKLKKPKAFGKARRAIAKKIREHERRMKSAPPTKKRELHLAINNLYALDRQIMLAWNKRIYCPA